MYAHCNITVTQRLKSAVILQLMHSEVFYVWSMTWSKSFPLFNKLTQLMPQWVTYYKKQKLQSHKKLK